MLKIEDFSYGDFGFYLPIVELPTGQTELVNTYQYENTPVFLNPGEMFFSKRVFNGIKRYYENWINSNLVDIIIFSIDSLDPRNKLIKTENGLVSESGEYERLIDRSHTLEQELERRQKLMRKTFDRYFREYNLDSLKKRQLGYDREILKPTLVLIDDSSFYLAEIFSNFFLGRLQEYHSSGIHFLVVSRDDKLLDRRLNIFKGRGSAFSVRRLGIPLDVKIKTLG